MAVEKLGPLFRLGARDETVAGPGHDEQRGLDARLAIKGEGASSP
jgi:hypothetical protein